MSPTTPSTREDLKDWLTRKAPPHSLALFRVFFPLSLMVAWIPKAQVEPVTLTIILFVLLLAVTIGLWMKQVALLCVILYVYFILSMEIETAMLEPCAVFILLVIAFSGADRTLSMAMRKKYASAVEWEYTSVFPQRLLALILTVIYLVIGVQRFWIPMWQSGASLWSGAIGARIRPAASWVARQRFSIGTFNWATYLAKAFGIMLPPCLWLRTIRMWFFVGGALMHVLSGLFLGTWWMSILIPIYVLLIEPEDMMKNVITHKKKNNINKPKS